VSRVESGKPPKRGTYVPGGASYDAEHGDGQPEQRRERAKPASETAQSAAGFGLDEDIPFDYMP
jgi:hypothetical protein